MKFIKYKISKNEDIGNIPYNSIILNAKLVCEGDGTDLIYFPQNVKYQFEGEIFYDKGCGSLSFARKANYEEYWVKSEHNYINLERKTKLRMVLN